MYGGKLENDESIDMSVYFYDLPTTSKRRNKYVYPSPQAGSLEVFNIPGLLEDVGIDRNELQYLYPSEYWGLLAPMFLLIFRLSVGKGQDTLVPLTIWIIADLDDPEHAELLKESLKALVRRFMLSIATLHELTSSFQDATSSFRLSFLHVPRYDTLRTDAADTHASVSSLLYRTASVPAVSSASPADILAVLEQLSPNPDKPLPEAREQLILANDPRTQGSLDQDSETEINWQRHQETLRGTALFSNSIGLVAGEAAIVINGRVRLYYQCHALWLILSLS